MVKDCPHILVIDDDLRLRNLLQRYLQENGFAVTGAKDAERECGSDAARSAKVAAGYVR